MFTTNVNHPVPRLLRNCPRVIIQFLNSVLSYMNLALLELLPWWFFFSLWIFCKPQKLSRTFHDRFMLNVALSQILLTLCALLGSSDVTNCHYWEAYHKMSYLYATQYSLPLRLNVSVTVSTSYFHMAINEAFLGLKSAKPASPSPFHKPVSQEARFQTTILSSITLVPFKAKGHRLLSYICSKATRPTKDNRLGKHRVTVCRGRCERTVVKNTYRTAHSFRLLNEGHVSVLSVKP